MRATPWVLPHWKNMCSRKWQFHTFPVTIWCNAVRSQKSKYWPVACKNVAGYIRLNWMFIIYMRMDGLSEVNKEHLDMTCSRNNKMQINRKWNKTLIVKVFLFGWFYLILIQFWDDCMHKVSMTELMTCCSAHSRVLRHPLSSLDLLFKCQKKIFYVMFCMWM